MLHFIRTAIWSHLPSKFPPKHRYWAAGLWGAGLLAYGLYLGWARERAHETWGIAPSILIILGVILAILLPLPEPIGTTTYLWVLRVVSIIGFVVSTVVLTLAFYLIVTPMGLLMRLTGRDPLRVSAKARPEWIEHRGSPERRRYFRQF